LGLIIYKDSPLGCREHQRPHSPIKWSLKWCMVFEVQFREMPNFNNLQSLTSLILLVWF